MRAALGTIVGAVMWTIMRLALMISTTARPPRRATGGGPIKILATGRMDSKNWCQSHLTPLRKTPEIAEIILVVDGTVAAGPKTRQVPVPGIIGWIRPRAFVRSIWTICVAMKEKPDVIMAYSLFPPGVFSLIAGRFSGAAVIVQLTGGLLEIESGGHATDKPFIPEFLKRRLVPLCLKLCGQFDAVVVRGRKAAAYLQEHAQPKRVEIVPGSVDPARFTLNQFKRNIDVVFIGRIVAVKQPDHVVEILERVARRRPGLRAVVAGKGPLLDAMKRQAREKGIARNVCFAGHVEKVEGLLVRSRIFLLTSKSEGLSIALAEAMLGGAVPVVANVGDLGELVASGQTGYLIKPGDFDAYADKICALLDDEQAWTKMSAEGRRAAHENNSVDAVVRRWQTCLPEIIRGPQTVSNQIPCSC